MVAHPNFYENIQEALLRLKNTVVLYDGEPFYILTITDHSDGKFRVYMCHIKDAPNCHLPVLSALPHGHPSMASQLDPYVGTKSAGVEVIRKQMDSPKFNKFRPFPLGMMNLKGGCIYVERKPLRPKTEQGLTANMLEGTPLSACMINTHKSNIGMFSVEFRDCIMGDYPSPNECLKGLKGDNINYSVGFNRNFALIRGPIDTLFLAYKNEVVGALPRGDFSGLVLGRKHKHLKEVCQELKLFSQIV